HRWGEQVFCLCGRLGRAHTDSLVYMRNIWNTPERIQQKKGDAMEINQLTINWINAAKLALAMAGLLARSIVFPVVMVVASKLSLYSLGHSLSRSHTSSFSSQIIIIVIVIFINFKVARCCFYV